MTLTLAQLQGLAADGVDVRISAADLLAVIKELGETGILRAREDDKPYSIPQAAEFYGKNTCTIRRWIAGGILRADKVGGEWQVENPKARARRLADNAL